MRSFDWRQFREQWLRSRDQVPPLPAYPGPLPPLPDLPPASLQVPEPVYICPICVAIQMEQAEPASYPIEDADGAALCAHHLRTIELLSQYNVLFDAAGNPVYDHHGDWRLVNDHRWQPFAAYHRAEQIRGWKRHGRRLLRHKRNMHWMDQFDTPEADRIRSDEEGE